MNKMLISVVRDDIPHYIFITTQQSRRDGIIVDSAR